MSEIVIKASPLEAGIASLYREDGPKSRSLVAKLVEQKPEDGKPERWELLMNGHQPVMLEGSLDECTEDAVEFVRHGLTKVTAAVVEAPAKKLNPGLEKANANRKAKAEAAKAAKAGNQPQG